MSESKGELKQQLVKFLAAGVVAAATHYGLYVGLVTLADLTPVLATLAGFVVSTGVSYVLNSRYTFEATHSQRAFVRFWIVTIGGGMLNAIVVELTVRLGLHFAIAGVVAIVVGASFNFTGHRLWTFR